MCTSIPNSQLRTLSHASSPRRKRRKPPEARSSWHSRKGTMVCSSARIAHSHTPLVAMRNTMKHVRAITAATFAMLLFGCTKDMPMAERLVATGGTSPHAVASMHAGSKLPRHEEDAFARLADDEPSSAGFYADQQGRVVVTVSDSTAVGRAISAMARRQSATDVPLHPALRSASIIVKRGSYSFQQLSDWRDSVYLRMLGPVKGVIYDDLDEVANRVTIGVASAVPSARGEATAMLTKLGIPLAAVNFVTAEPLRPTAAASARAATVNNG